MEKQMEFLKKGLEQARKNKEDKEDEREHWRGGEGGGEEEEKVHCWNVDFFQIEP